MADYAKLGIEQVWVSAPSATRLAGSKSSPAPSVPQPGRAVIRYSVFYPVTEGATFDHDYYRDKHIPLVVKTWSPLEAKVDRGIDGPYVAAAHMLFADRAAFDAAMALQETADVRADIANYTTISAVRQISETS